MTQLASSFVFANSYTLSICFAFACQNLNYKAIIVARVCLLALSSNCVGFINVAELFSQCQEMNRDEYFAFNLTSVISTISKCLLTSSDEEHCLVLVPAKHQR